MAPHPCPAFKAGTQPSDPFGSDSITVQEGAIVAPCTRAARSLSLIFCPFKLTLGATVAGAARLAVRQPVLVLGVGGLHGNLTAGAPLSCNKCSHFLHEY